VDQHRPPIYKGTPTSVRHVTWINNNNNGGARSRHVHGPSGRLLSDHGVCRGVLLHFWLHDDDDAAAPGPGRAGRVCVCVLPICALEEGRAAGEAGVRGGAGGRGTQPSDAVPRTVPQQTRVPGGLRGLPGSVSPKEHVGCVVRDVRDNTCMLIVVREDPHVKCYRAPIIYTPPSDNQTAVCCDIGSEHPDV